MTLTEALQIAESAYLEDEAEREAILDALAPILLGDHNLLWHAINRAWQSAGLADEIRAALTAYQADRAQIDAQIDAEAEA